MKNKKGILFLFLLLAFLGIGCGNTKAQREKEYKIYYLDRDENHISAVPYESKNDKNNKKELAMELLEQLSIQTEEIEYKPVITGFSLKDCNLHESQITINFSEEYKLLKPVKEVLVRAAIVKTLVQIEGIELVTLQVNGRNLTDHLGNTVGVMSADTFVDNTGEDMKKYEQTTLTLYFANKTGDGLIKVNRTLRYNTNIALEKLVVEQLVSGPIEQKGKENEQTIFPSLNSEIKIISVNVKDSICYVNLNDAFLTNLNSVSTEIAIYSLVNSLTELPGVVKVQLAVDGETEIMLGEKYALSTLFERNMDLIQTEENKGK